MKNQHAVAAHFAGTWNEVRVQRWAEGVRAKLEAPSVTLGLIFMTPHFFDVAEEVLEVIRVHAARLGVRADAKLVEAHVEFQLALAREVERAQRG